MGERLRKVAEEGAGVRIDLFGKKTEVVGVGEREVQIFFGLVESALTGKRFFVPEAAEVKGALL